MPANLYQLKGYKILRADRISHAGGAAIFIKSNIHHNIILKSPNDSDMEYLFIEISAADSKILIGTVYRPKKTIAITTLVEFLHDNSVTYNNIVIAGDLNSNLLTETSLKADFASLGLYPCNTVVPTHFTSTCNTLLDLFIVNDLSKCLL